MTALAIYDMDKTVTRRPTYAAFLIHAALRLAPWRLLLAPAAGMAGLSYLAGFIGRGRLKEINYRLLVGGVAPARLEPLVESFAERQLTGNILPGARARLAAARRDVADAGRVLFRVVVEIRGQPALRLDRGWRTRDDSMGRWRRNQDGSEWRH